MGWKQKIGCSIFSRHFWEHIKHEPNLVLKRLSCFGPRNLWRIYKHRQQKELKLNIGSGPHEVKGWVGIDLFSEKTGIRWDVRWGLPFKTDTVSEIHCEHFLEHLDYPNDAMGFLRECHRVLSPGGQFRLIVPDAEKYISAYSQRDQRFWKALHDLGGHPTSFDTEIEVINQSFRMGGEHRFAYDKPTLELTLKRAGFKKVKEADFCPEKFLDLGDDWRLRESMYLCVYR